MLSELDVSFIFSSNGSISRPPLPSTGSLGSVPPLRRYYERLGLLCALPTSLRFLRSAVPSLRPCSLQRAGTLLSLTRVSFSGSLFPLFRTEALRSPTFLGNLRVRALLYDPGEPDSPSQLGFVGVASANSSSASALTTAFISGLNHTAAHSLSTLRSGGHPPPTQDSLPGEAATPSWAGLITRKAPS